METKQIDRNKETCATCRYFRIVCEAGRKVGRCYRMPPVWTAEPEDAQEDAAISMSQFSRPDVKPDDFCGEWTLQSQN